EKEKEEQAAQEEKNKAIAAAEALSVLKNIDKAKKKAKKRKKLQEFAKKAAEDKINKEFNKVLAKNMTSGSGLGKKGRGRGAHGGGVDLNDSDKANIMAQIVPYWAVASGVKDAENMIIEINMELRSNGEVIPSSIKILDENRYRNDSIFRAAADSAKRAVLQASPLSIPRNKIALLQEVTLRFNMKEALGR
ncbi:MAG: TonB C-terminal domain-containing protein, partial [Holosporaceae bacterium]|nr:TonB C-terminal domain-containing protein [Holosporaceae bacterium]